MNTEYREVDKERREGVLIVHDLDGALSHYSEFGVTDGFAVRSLFWSADGKTLSYRDHKRCLKRIEP